MAAALINSRANPLVKQARALHARKVRAKTGLFLIEGLQPIGAAVEAGWEIPALFYSPDLLSSAFGRQLVSEFTGRCEAVSADVLASLAVKDNPQGIVAVARQQYRSLDAIPLRGGSIALVQPQDPGNVGSILRTLDAAAGSGLFLLDDGVDVYHPTAIRAAMGATFTVPFAEAGFADFIAWCRAHQVQLIGTSARAELSYLALPPTSPWVLLFGSEQKGLSDTQKRTCDYCVAIPMHGRASSLNLSVAAGILLFTYGK